MKNKWELAREAEIESVRQLVGRTITEVKVWDRGLELTFDDGSTLDIGCYVDQRGCSDIAELSFDVGAPNE